MAVETYICKGCGREEDLDPINVTFPQCPECYGIMAATIEYDTPIADLIPQLEVLWYQHWPDVPVHVQLIYNDRRFKFRWFNGPNVEAVKHNSSFMNGYHLVADAAEIPKNRRTHKRIFKQYIGPTGPQRTFDQLTAEEKLNLLSFVEKNIEHIREERYSLNVIVDEAESTSSKLIFTYGDDESLDDGIHVNYWCNVCECYIGLDSEPELDARMIQHVIDNHLN
jgi:hypothetical protein